MTNLENKHSATFREKMAWVMTAALLIASGVFFHSLWNVSTSLEQVPKQAVLVMLVLFAIILTIIAIAGAIVAALSNVSEADEPMDERDKQITLKATHLGSIATGMVLVFTCLAYFYDARSSDMLLGIIAALILGHLVEYIFQIYLYRRKIYHG